MEAVASERSLELDLTTETLTSLWLEIPNLLQDRGLTPSFVPMLLVRPVDMYFLAPAVSDAAIADIIAASGANLVFMAQHHFEADQLLNGDDDELPEDTTEASRVLEKAEMREGELCSISLTWAAQSLVYRWQGIASWADQLQELFDEALGKARNTEREEHEKRTGDLRARIQALISEIMSNPEYRKTPPHRRSIVAKTLVSEPQGDDEETVHRLGLSETSRRDREASEMRTLDITSRIDELAQDLVETTSWRAAMTQATRKSVAREYLIERYDGWCPPASLAQELSGHAARKT